MPGANSLIPIPMSHVYLHPDAALDAVGVEAMVSAAWSSGRLLKEDRSVRVAGMWWHGRDYVVKSYAMNACKAWVYHAVRRTPAWREWAGAWRLERAGVRAVKPVALVHHGWGRWKQSLVMPYVEGLPLNHFLADGSVSGERRLAVLGHVRRQMEAMVRAGIVNRDHKAANLLVDSTAGAGVEPPVILDAAGLRRATPRRVLQMRDLLAHTAGAIRPLTEEEREALGIAKKQIGI